MAKRRDSTTTPLHPLVKDASEGKLPKWSSPSAGRKKHMLRVADLMGDWASALGLADEAVHTWRAAGLLHDALREVPPSELAELLPDKHLELPPKAYHGPAAAVRLSKDGVEDKGFLQAIRWHTLGSPKLALIGKALYAADFLEPGRRSRRRWREGLRSRAPRHLNSVLREIVGSRIDYLLRAEMPVPRPTLGFWNSLVEDR